MKVTRNDVYDFSVTLTKDDFATLKVISVADDISIVEAFENAIANGLIDESFLATEEE